MGVDELVGRVVEALEAVPSAAQADVRIKDCGMGVAEPRASTARCKRVGVVHDADNQSREDI
jgi:hypothetical protein